MSEDSPNGNPDPPNKFEEGNDHGVKHGLFQDYANFLDNMSAEEKRLVGEMSEEFVAKFEAVHDESPGVAEREIIRNLILDTLKRRRANEYMFSEGEFINFDQEQRHNTYSRIRRDNQEEMEKLGLLETPESEKQRNEASWFEAMEGAKEDDE